MKNIALSKKEKIILELRYKECRDRQQCDRIKAVLLSDEGWSSAKIAQALRKHKSNINRHLNEFIEAEKLGTISGGSQSYLTPEETQN